MRRLVSLMHMSLDGYVAGPNREMDWIKHGDPTWNFVDAHINQVDTGLYGPITFQMMESHWPKVLLDDSAEGHQRSHSRWYAASQKIVFSRSLRKLENPAARLINDNIAEQINALKKLPGKNLMIFGSPGLTHSLAALGLIDEYVITVSPVLLGSGIPMFAHSDHRVALQLTSSTPFGNGAIGLHYTTIRQG
jgi:dihydrofolate reductase